MSCVCLRLVCWCTHRLGSAGTCVVQQAVTCHSCQRRRRPTSAWSQLFVAWVRAGFIALACVWWVYLCHLFNSPSLQETRLLNTEKKLLKLFSGLCMTEFQSTYQLLCCCTVLRNSVKIDILPLHCPCHFTLLLVHRSSKPRRQHAENNLEAASWWRFNTLICINYRYY